MRRSLLRASTRATQEPDVRAPRVSPTCWRQRVRPLAVVVMTLAGLSSCLAKPAGAPISLGIDLGNHKCVCAVAKGHGVEVVVNAMSRRDTPTALSFKDRKRAFGDLAVAAPTQAPDSALQQLKRLLLPEEDEDEDGEGPVEPWGLGKVCGGDAWVPGSASRVRVCVGGKEAEVSVVQAMAMLLAHLQHTAAQQHSHSILNTVVSVPSWLPLSAHMMIHDACRIAQLPGPVLLLRDGTALAVAYALLNLPPPSKHSTEESSEEVVAFVDIGHASTQVTLAAVSASGVRVLAHEWDRTVSAHSLDRGLYKLALSKLRKKGSLELSPKQQHRLLAACAKAKKVLAAGNKEARLEGLLLSSGSEASVTLKAKDVESTAYAPLTHRLEALCKRAAARAGERAIGVVEVVGGASHVPCLWGAVCEGFKGCPVRRTLNGAESVAKGCALVAAQHSAAFRFARPFTVADALPRSLTYRLAGGEGTELSTRPLWVLPAHSPLPAKANATVCGSEVEGGVAVEVTEQDTKGLTARYSLDLSGQEGQWVVRGAVSHLGALDEDSITATPLDNTQGKAVHAEGRWHSGCLGLEDREAAQALHTRLEALDRLEEQRMEACNGLEEALYSAKETVDIEDDTHKVLLGGSAALVLAKVEEVEHWMDTRLDHTTPSDSNDDTQVFVSKRAEVERAVEVYKSHKALLQSLVDEMDTCTDVADSGLLVPSAVSRLHEGVTQARLALSPPSPPSPEALPGLLGDALAALRSVKRETLAGKHKDTLPHTEPLSDQEKEKPQSKPPPPSSSEGTVDEEVVVLSFSQQPSTDNDATPQ